MVEIACCAQMVRHARACLIATQSEDLSSEVLHRTVSSGQQRRRHSRPAGSSS